MNKSTFGFFLYQLIWLVFFYHLYLWYYAIRNFDLNTLLYLLVVHALGYLAKPSKLAIKILKWFRFQDYFDDYQLKVEDHPNPTHTMFVCHPHGVFPYGLAISLWTYDHLFHDATLLVTRMIIKAPFHGIFYKLINFDSVNCSNLLKYLRRGKNIGIIPGGYEEQTLNSYRENRLFLKSRKGFIKYALQYGYTIQSVFTFGDNKLYYTVDKLEWLGLWVNRVKLPLCICWPKYLVVPNADIRMRCVVGKKMVLPQIGKPSSEEVERYHKEYMGQLVELYEKHGREVGLEGELRIY